MQAQSQPSTKFVHVCDFFSVTYILVQIIEVIEIGCVSRGYILTTHYFNERLRSTKDSPYCFALGDDPNSFSGI